MLRFDTQDSLYDLSWSEAHENQIVVATGDGSIKLFDVTLNEFPLQSWQEHKREVFAVHWNLITKDTFCSSSWDGSLKLVCLTLPTQTSDYQCPLRIFQWSPQHTDSLLTIPTHSCTYSVAFSPHSPSVLSSVSSDSHFRLFDLRTPSSASNHQTLTIPLHAPPKGHGQNHLQQYPAAAPPSEALTHDWNKYRSDVIAAAGVDRFIRTFDLRAPNQGPLTIFAGHDYAVRKVAWSPHLSDVILSASYDMTCKVWTDGNGKEDARAGVMHGELGTGLGSMARHTEFVMGVDWCLFGAEGWCASCGWDERLLVWDVRGVIGPDKYGNG